MMTDALAAEIICCPRNWRTSGVTPLKLRIPNVHDHDILYPCVYQFETWQTAILGRSVV